MKRVANLLAILLSSSLFCSVSAANDAAISSEYLLEIFSRIASDEDLVDSVRIGKLLKREIRLLQLPSVELENGDMTDTSVADFDTTFSQHLGLQGYSSSKNRSRYGAYIDLNVDTKAICLNINQVRNHFATLSELHVSSPPISAPTPIDSSRPALLFEQPHYGYWLKTARSLVTLDFAYTNCLLSIRIEQPARKPYENPFSNEKK